MSTSDVDTNWMERLLEGDDEAFEQLIDTYHQEMVRLARAFVDDTSTAEEVVQETWIAVLDGLESFERRSSLKTWIFSILTNLAKKRGERDARTVPWSDLSEDALEDGLADDERFGGDGRWASPPAPWHDNPEQELMRNQLLEIVEEAIQELPQSQRAVVTMRDVQGWPSEEVCDVLELTPGNQRVLLHRARSHVRDALESHLADDQETPS